jgi:hypothetical protein
MTERERLLNEIAWAIAQRDPVTQPVNDLGEYEVLGMHYSMADAALKVLEKPGSDSGWFSYVICTCGQNGYPENSPHANHPHLEGCPHYNGTTQG